MPATDDRLDALLADYFQRLDRGESVSPTSLLAANPALESELREFFEAASFVENLAGPTQSEQTQMLGVHDTARNSLIGETIVSGVQTLNRGSKDNADGIPKHFGRYEIQKLLGQGAMGNVYLAYDPSLQRQVALKIPKFSDESNPDMRDRFLREARSAATLRHANICPVYDVGRVDGVHYITMAYIEGRTLAEELRAGRTFEPREIATIVRKLALALGKAHSAGVIHRDLKPGNIMLDGEGEPVLMDFGLAYREETDELRLTKSGMIVGSPAYMSPEQIDGDPTKIGSASDIYSLGVVLYEMITGKLPFQGTMMSVIGQIATKEPTPVGHWRKELADSPLERLCRKMLAKKIDDRPQTMQDVARALDFILSGLPGQRADGETERKRDGEMGQVAAAPPSAPLSVSPSLRLSPTSESLPVKYPEAVLAQERRDRAKMFLATTLILLVLLGLFGAAAGIVYVATDQGTLEITSHVDNVQIEVIGDNGTVKVLDLVSGTRVERLKSGEYTVVVKGNESNVAIDKGKFQITRGGNAIVTAHLQTKPPQPAVAASADPGRERPAGPQSAPQAKPEPIHPLARFGNHKNEIRGVAFAPDDKHFVTVGWDQMINLYNVETRQLVRSWPGHGQGIYRARFLADGRLLTCAYDGSIKLWNVAKPEEIKSLAGHSGPVTGLAVSKDGKRALSAGYDKSVRLWDLERLEEIRTFQKANSEWLWDAALSPDGKSAATVGFDGKIRLWNADTGEQTGEIAAHQGAALSVVYAGEGQVLSGGRDGALRLWDTQAKTKLREYAGFSGVWIESLSISQDGQRALVGLANPDKQPEIALLAGRCAVLDVTTMQVLAELPTGAPYIYGTAFSSDGSLALTGGGRGGPPATAQLWNVNDALQRSAKPVAKTPWQATLLKRLRGHDEYVLSVAFAKDDTILASTGADQKVFFWDPATGNSKFTSGVHTDDIRAIAFTPDNSRYVTASNDKTLHVWNAETRVPEATLRAHKGPVSSVIVLDGGKRAVSSSDDKSLILWDLIDSKPLYTAEFHTAPVSCLALSPDGKSIASAGKDNQVILSEIQADKLVLKQRLRGHTGEVRGLAFTPDGQYVVSGGRDGFVRFWTIATGKPHKTIAPGIGVVYSVAVSPDGKLLAVGGGDWTKGSVKLYACPTGLVLAEIRDFQGFVHALDFAADSATLAAGSADKTVSLWRLSENISAAPSLDPSNSTSIPEISTAERLFTGQNSSGFAVAVSRDGAQALVGHYGGGLSLWDVATGTQIRQFVGADKAVHSVLFWPDGQHVAAASEDGTIRLWNRETAEEVRQFKGHAGRVDCLALSGDGSLLLSGSADYGEARDQSVRLWNAANGQELRQFDQVVLYMRDLTFSRDASRAFGAGVGLTSVIEWDVATGAPVHRFRDCPTAPISLALSPNGRLLATGHMARRHKDNQWNDPDNSVVRLWDLESRSIVSELRGHAGPVGDVAFTPDGRYLLSAATSEHDVNNFIASNDQTVRVWDVASGLEVAQYQTQERVIQLAVMPDGKSFLTVGDSIRLWRLPESIWQQPPATSPPIEESKSKQD